MRLPIFHRPCLAPGAVVGALVAALLSAASLAAQPVPASALVRRPLPRDTVIAGIPCARSGRAPAEFHRAGGQLAGCALAHPFTESGHRFDTGTWLDRNADGRLWGAWLSSDTSLDGFTCRGEGYKKWSTRFHPNGRLASCYLAADTVIAGIPCMAGSFYREVRGGGKSTLYLGLDGLPVRCQAARDTVRNGVPIRKWSVVRLSPT